MFTEGIPNFTANGALVGNRRVKITSGTTTAPPQVEYAGLGEADIGITEYDIATGEVGAVRLNNHTGTREITAAGAISRGAAVYPAASGKISDVVAGQRLGYAAEAATADGDIIEIIPDRTPQYSVPFVGTHTTVGGDADETITATGVVGTDTVLVSVSTQGAAPVTVLQASAGTDTIAVKMSADPSNDHVLTYLVLRAT